MNKIINVIKKHTLSNRAFSIRILLGSLLLSSFLLEGCSSGNSDSVDSDIGISDIEISSTELPDKESSDMMQPEEDQEKIQEEAQEKIQEEADTDETTASGLAGKKLSIFGDSISTFVGWIPEGYYDFFPMNGTIADVEQTWWKMVLSDTGMCLCVNGSSSGSTCAGYSLGTNSPQEGCSEFRINGLINEDGSSPDIIIVYMGSNDFIKNIPLGDNDGTREVEEGNVENFSDAYCLILDKLHARYPDAGIFCCNLLPIGGMGDDGKIVLFTNRQGLNSDSYSRQIEIIASAKGYPVIDLEHCGITVESLAQYTGDGLHPNPEGMKLIRDAVEAVITDH